MDTDGLDYRWLEPDDLERIANIDRSERVDSRYVVTPEGLEARPASHQIPGWSDDPSGDQALRDQIAFCRDHLKAGAQALGCFDRDDLLAGLGLMRPDVEPGVAQLAYLAVSRPLRRHGVGQAMLDRLVAWAVQQGALEVYVSSAPREPAVNFYRRAGFVPTDRPIAELHELEPEDVHMRLSLQA